MESLAAQKNADEAEKLRAQMIRGGGGGGRSTTERERLGIGAPQVANLQKQTLDVSKMQLSEMQKLNANVNKLIASGNGAGNPDGW